MKRYDWKRTFVGAWLKFWHLDMFTYAANVTYYILLACMPLFMSIIAICNLLPDFSVDVVVQTINALVPDISAIHSLVYDVVENLNAQSNAWLASLAALTAVWSASYGISAMQKGLKKISGESYSFFRDKPSALLYTIFFQLLLALFLIFNLLSSSLVKILDQQGIHPYLHRLLERFMTIASASGLVTMILTFVMMLLMYTFLPRDHRKWKHQAAGAVLVTLLWIIFSRLFTFFMTRLWVSSFIYGSLTAIFLLNLWLWFIMCFFFYGACLNQSLFEQRQEQKKKNAQNSAS